MPVVVDDLPLSPESLGLSTVGDLLSHLTRSKRLVVNLLIDGAQPDLAAMRTVRAGALAGRAIYVETSDPAEIAAAALGTVATQLTESLRLGSAAAELLRGNHTSRALEQLSGYFTVLQNAQDAVQKVCQLLRVDLAAAPGSGRSLLDLLNALAAQLRSLRGALESRDYVAMIDALEYETRPAIELYSAAISQLQSSLRPARRAA